MQKIYVYLRQKCTELAKKCVLAADKALQ